MCDVGGGALCAGARKSRLAQNRALRATTTERITRLLLFLRLWSSRRFSLLGFSASLQLSSTGTRVPAAWLPAGAHLHETFHFRYRTTSAELRHFIPQFLRQREKSGLHLNRGLIEVWRCRR